MNSLEYENLLENKTHADPMFPYNTYLCSIPLDFNSVSLHWHEFMEIIYIKKGKGNVTVDFTTHYVEEGDIVIILPGHIHGISQHEGYSMEYENILFSVDMFRSRNHDSLDSEFSCLCWRATWISRVFMTGTTHYIRLFPRVLTG